MRFKVDGTDYVAAFAVRLWRQQHVAYPGPGGRGEASRCITHIEGGFVGKRGGSYVTTSRLHTWTDGVSVQFRPA